MRVEKGVSVGVAVFGKGQEATIGQFVLFYRCVMH